MEFSLDPWHETVSPSLIVIVAHVSGCQLDRSPNIRPAGVSQESQNTSQITSDHIVQYSKVDSLTQNLQSFVTTWVN
jgi:hypothetical protein